MKLSIVIPARNEEKRIIKTLEEYGQFFTDLKKNKILDSEILIIINNTKDRTEDVVKKYSEKYPIIRWLNFKQGGKGFAIIEGFKEALKKETDFIGFVDADMSNSTESFYDLVLNMQDNDGTIASRWMKGSVIKTKQTALRRIMSWGFNFLVRSILFLPYKDTQCGAKVFTKKAIESVVNDLGLTKWAFDIDLLYKLKKRNFKIKEIPTTWEDKADSRINFAKVPFQMFSAVIRLRIKNSKFNFLVRGYDLLPPWLKVKI